MQRFMYMLFLIISGIFVSCAALPKSDPAVIRIKGSDTMLILVQAFADAYMTSYPAYKVTVEGGGSGTGFRALIEGRADIAMSSRLISPQEAYQMAQTYRSIGLSYLVAKDALSLFLHPANKIETLTMGDLELIFSGQIDNWLVFSNTIGKIQPVIRPPESGTHMHFKLHVLKGNPYSPQSLIINTTKDIARYVSQNKGAIGYGGIAYSDSVYTAPLNGLVPSEENVRNDSYPLTRYLYFYTVTTPPGNVAKFIDWVISPAGQAIVNQVGYFPLWE